MDADNKQSFFSKLMERRFFQYLGSYLLGVWALVQFIDWMANRFDYSAFWSEVVLYFFAILIPSAILIIYFHGQSGTQKWSRLEKVFIPLNIIFAVLLTINFFVNRNIDYLMDNFPDHVTVLDEDGNEVNRIVPQADQTRRIVFFPFADESENEKTPWESYGIPKLLAADLEQDNRLYALSPFSLSDEFIDYGYQIDKKAPFSILRKIADDAYADIFFTGSFKKVNELYQLSIEAFSTRDGKSFFTIAKEGADLFTIADEITEAFQKNLSLPDLEKDIPIVDLPSSNLYSEKTEAFQNYINALVENNFNNNPQAAVTYMKKATEIDPDCAPCNSQLGFYQFRLSKSDEALASYKRAMQHIDILPERQQLDIKYWNYRAHGNTDKMIALANMWMQFYPNDYKPYSYLISRHSRRAEFDQAREVCNKAISRGHKGNVFLQAANIATAQGDTKTAQNYYNQFQEAYPHRAKETMGLAEIYINEGDFDKARQHLQKLQILKSNDPEFSRALARLEFLSGNLNKAVDYMHESLSFSKTARDSFNVYLALEQYHVQLGQIDKSLELKQKKHEVQKSFSSPMEIQIEFTQFHVIDQYLKGGKRDEIEAKVTPLMQPNPSFPTLPCGAKLNFYLAIKDLAKSEEVEAECREIALKVQGAITYLIVDAFLADIKNEHDKAANAMEQFIEATKINDPYINTYLIRFYRKSNQLNKGKTLIKEILEKTPIVPEAIIELALINQQEGNKTEAVKNLNKALDIWKDADDTFIPAQEARVLLEGLK